jgi:hypothetical protein
MSNGYGQQCLHSWQVEVMVSRLLAAQALKFNPESPGGGAQTLFVGASKKLHFSFPLPEARCRRSRNRIAVYL